NREVRGAIALNALPQDLFQNVLPATQIRAELLRGLFENLDMPIAVARDFMAVGANLADEFWKRFRQFAKHEHRGAYAGIPQKLQNAMGVCRSALRDRQTPIPTGLRPVFDVDRYDRRTKCYGLRHTW